MWHGREELTGSSPYVFEGRIREVVELEVYQLKSSR